MYSGTKFNVFHWLLRQGSMYFIGSMSKFNAFMVVVIMIGLA